MPLFTIPAHHLKSPKFSALSLLLGAISSYICIIPLVLIDLFLWQFQVIYFGLSDIPRIQRKKYLVFDRFQLQKLSLPQKINCLYCEYANGIVAYAKDVVHQMELYSCAIKHTHQPLGQEDDEKYFERKKFE